MMIHPSFSRGSFFEVSLYNKEVRALVKENKSHGVYEDHWADRHIHGIIARDAREARALAQQRYPKKDGFVIEAIVRSED